MLTSLRSRRVAGLRVGALLAALALAGPVQAQDGATDAAPDVAALRTAAEAAGDDPAPWTALGNALLESDPEDAGEAFLEAIALDYRTCDAHFGLGLAETAQGDVEGGLFAFDEVARLCPTRFDGHYNRGVTLARLGRAEAAVAAFQRALEEADPGEASVDDRVAAWRGVATQRARVGDADGAAAAYADARAVRPGDADLIYLHAEALHEAGRGLEALPDLTELAREGAEARVDVLVADVYAAAGRLEYALRGLERGIERAAAAGDDAGEAARWLALGRLQDGVGRREAAAEAYRTAVAIDPTSAEAYTALGRTLLEAGDAAGAASALARAAEIAPGDPAIALVQANALAAQDRHADAVAAARRALASAPDDATEVRLEAQRRVGRSAYALGDLAARDAWRVVTDARPDDGNAWTWAGLAAYADQAYPAAVRALETATNLEPDDRVARRNLAAAYLAVERYAEAENVYALLLEQTPDDAEAAYHLGWARWSLERPDDARDAWANACDLGYGSACDALDDLF
ncbi:MAG: tetratricopeptide repeat protein [Trueperaceae bacterium]|nr:tetratricopeptide repeat protein [Trueperaceae bacterium]